VAPDICLTVAHLVSWAESPTQPLTWEKRPPPLPNPRGGGALGQLQTTSWNFDVHH